MVQSVSPCAKGGLRGRSPLGSDQRSDPGSTAQELSDKKQVTYLPKSQRFPSVKVNCLLDNIRKLLLTLCAVTVL